MQNTRATLIGSSILAIGFILGIVLIGNTWRSTSSANQNITVTGSAKRLLTSDIGVLRANASLEMADQLEAYRAITAQKPIILAFLQEKGIDPASVKFYPVFSFANYNYNLNGQQTTLRGYQYSQRFELSSKDVKKIEALSQELGGLIEQGVNVSIESTEYYYSQIGDIKIEIQAEAAKDAAERAARIAEATGRELGPLTGARMGVLQITPVNSNLTSDYGINDASSIEKEITAVVNATFRIE